MPQGRLRNVDPRRPGLSWLVSITLDTAFCLDAVAEALARYGRPEIFNTDQGAQFTSAVFTGMLQDQGIAISMDGKGCRRDNIFVERLWRSIKYEEVYLHAYASVSDAKAGVSSPATSPPDGGTPRRWWPSVET